MNNTPQWIKDEWDKVPREKLRCVRVAEGDCKGRLTKEHALIYAGRQIQELGAILDMCEYHHGVCRYMDRGALNKKVNQVIAAHNMTEKEREKYPRFNWKELLRWQYDPSQPSLLKKA